MQSKPGHRATSPGGAQVTCSEAHQDHRATVASSATPAPVFTQQTTPEQALLLDTELGKSQQGRPPQGRGSPTRQGTSPSTRPFLPKLLKGALRGRVLGDSVWSSLRSPHQAGGLQGLVQRLGSQHVGVSHGPSEPHAAQLGKSQCSAHTCTWRMQMT